MHKEPVYGGAAFSNSIMGSFTAIWYIIVEQITLFQTISLFVSIMSIMFIINRLFILNLLFNVQHGDNRGGTSHGR